MPAFISPSSFLSTLRVEQNNGRFRGGMIENAPLARLVTFRIGGPVAAAITPADISSFSHALSLCRRAGVPFRIIGGGSNLLPSDEGYFGVVFLTKQLNKHEFFGTKCVAECGTPLAALIMAAARRGLGGIERLSGIPATLGGAAVMNAGAHGAEISDVLEEVEVLSPFDGRRFRLGRSALAFSYRHSLFSERRDLVILRAVLALRPTDGETAVATVRETIARRLATQPLSLPSAGSVFRRPRPDIEVWRLLDGVGLRGARVGDAQISEKHAGFIVNRGAARAADVRALIEQAKARVFATYQIKLTEEIECF